MMLKTHSTRTLLFAFWGALAVILLATVQHVVVLGVALSPVKFVIPSLVGGIAGLGFGRWYLKLKDYHRALETSEERYRNLFENANDLIQSINPEGRIEYVNRSWRQTLGYSIEEIRDLNIFDIIHPVCRDHCRQSFQQLLSGSAVERIEGTFLAKDGRAIVLEGSISCRYQGGEMVSTLGIFRDITDRKQAESQIEQLAYYDTLTGLPNRALLHDRLQQALTQAQRTHSTVGVLFLDLDRFKGVNDTLGHFAGDLLLKTVAQRLLDCGRKSDTVARLGGDEFVLILNGAYHDQWVATFAQKVLETVATPVKIGEQEVYSTASIGIALFPADGQNVEVLLRNADTAMYAAKDHGRNGFRFFSAEMNVKANERLALETGLRQALQSQELFLEYQPQLDLATGRIAAVEVLTRWRHPQLGEVPPSTFIPLAEETGLILALGAWVLRSACSQIQTLQQEGGPPLRVAVNLSGRQFKQLGFIDIIDQVLEETGLDPALLELELTESTIMEAATETVELLSELKVRGIRLSIDDFGTGYSSLSYLKNFPIDRIKVAQEFVRDILHDPNDAAIVDAIIAMGSSLGLEVVAEGVESREQLEFLHARGCSQMQGFYFGRSMPVAELEKLLRQNQVGAGACPFKV